MRRGNLRLLLIGIAMAAAVALVSPLASSNPDGLEKVAEDQGFLDRARDAPLEVLPDYSVPGVANEGVSTVLAGLIGIAVVTGGTLAVARILARRAAPDTPTGTGSDPPRRD